MKKAMIHEEGQTESDKNEIWSVVCTAIYIRPGGLL